MANSLKVSELEELTTADGSELLLVSKDKYNVGALSSYGISFGVLSSKIYNDIMNAVNDSLRAISTALSNAVDYKFDNDGISSLPTIINNVDNIVGTSPGKVVGIKPIYDMYSILSDALVPKWQ